MISVLKDGSCAIRCHEPCQAGDRAALSEFSDVPQACLSGAETAVTRIFVLSIDAAWSDFVSQFALFRRTGMYQALYRKWRPQTYEDVIGQRHITEVLKSEISSGKISHAYLFCGPRGTGKTTCAKIIARAVNCENPVNGSPCGKCKACKAILDGTATDIVEMDAASNNGVDDIRDIRDAVVYTPAELKYRVFIIDEVHMLSISAFNALLKTLEEPPAHVIFVLATTELQKIPATIMSRCQRFDFHRVTPNDIIARMKTVCEGEKIEADEGALDLIARMAQGSFRDALNMLEFCAGSSDKITLEKATDLLGASPVELLSDICSCIADRRTADALKIIDNVYLSSRDIAVFWRELISYMRDVMMTIATRGSYSTDPVTKQTAEKFTVMKVMRILEVFTQAEGDMNRLPQNAKLYAEMAVVKVCDPTLDTDPTALVNRIADLEEKVASGNFKKAVSAPAEKAEEKKSVEDLFVPFERFPEQKTYEGKLQLTSCRMWPEVIKKVQRQDSMLAAFIRGAQGYTGSDGKFYINCDNDFASSYVNDIKRLPIVILAINQLCNTAYSDKEVVVRYVPDETEKTPFDNLLEQIGKDIEK